MEITGYSGDEEEIVIPDEIEGKRVTRIGELALPAFLPFLLSSPFLFSLPLPPIFGDATLVTIYAKEKTMAEYYAFKYQVPFVAIENDEDVIYGDANGDGEVDIADALMISQYDAGLLELDESQLSNLDVNGDGEINIADALMISQYDAGIISEFTNIS